MPTFVRVKSARVPVFVVLSSQNASHEVGGTMNTNLDEGFKPPYISFRTLLNLVEK